jgi:adenylate cyclase
VRSLAEVMAPDNSQLLTEWFHDKIVLIGSWSIEEHDYVSTPLIRTALDRAASGADGDRRVEKPTAGLGESGTSKIGYHGGVAEENGAFESGYRFGLEVHANAIHSLLDRHYYQDFDERKRVMLVWMCGLITALLVARLRPVRALPAIVALLGIIWWFVFFSFRFYVFLRPIQIGLATVLAYGLETVYFYGVENRRAVRARNTFQRYVGPRVMASVLDTNFKPGSVEQRHLTIMFTDVQGFTSLSEKMPPQEVVATFNRYLNQMVEIIDKYGGTLDKIMGDGVMAYFNAPLPVEHHEQKAVECALEMQAAMRSWRELAESLGLPPLKVRIGINCGDVVFGEVGAKRQLGYTVIGDAVNAAARLEPLNKEFGTEILISEAVLSELDGTFETHYVGELAIRGREEGIRAYSVTGRKPVGSDG